MLQIIDCHGNIMDVEKIMQSVPELFDVKVRIDERLKKLQLKLEEKWELMINKSMISTPLGLVTAHVTTNEPIPENFKLKFKFLVDKCIAAKTFNPPYTLGNFISFERETGPTEVIEIRTQLFELIRVALNSQKPFSEVYKIVTCHLCSFLDLPVNSISKGLNRDLLQYIEKCSPCIYVLVTQLPQGKYIGREGNALYQKNLVFNLLFGCKKTNSKNFFEDVLNHFYENTDRANLLERGLQMENLPNAIMIMAENNIGDIRTEVDIKEILSTFTISKSEDWKWSIDYLRSINLVDPIFYFDEENELHSTSKHELRYFTLDQHSKAVIIPVDEYPFLCDTKDKFQQKTTFLDLMVPTGVRLEDHRFKGEGCFQMTTIFRDNSRKKTYLSLASILPFIKTIFQDKLEFGLNISPHSLYSCGNIDGKTPVGFSCDKKMIGKTFLFYHHAEDSNMSCSENKKRKISRPASSKAEDTTYRTLHLNKYVLQNHYMTRDLIVSNIINTYCDWDDIKNIWKDRIMNDPEDAQENQLRTEENPITDKQINVHIPGHVSELASLKQKVFVTELVTYVVKQLFPDFSFPSLVSKINEITLFVLAIQNKHLKLDLEPSLLNFINPGFGVIWVKPEVVETEPIIVCRPRSYGNLFKMHKFPENHANGYVVATDRIPFRNTIAGGSIFVPNAIFKRWISNCSDKVIDPSNKSQTDEEFEILKNQNNNNDNGWWPVICPPSMDVRMFNTANSPIGRLATHFEDKDDFKNNFNNPKVRDIEFVKDFTLNPVFSDVFSNINTLVLYPGHVIEDPLCPLNKYLTFNELASRNVDAIKKNATRIANLKTSNPDLKTHDAAGENIQHSDDYQVSRLIGSAFPKTCWSERKLENSNPEVNNCILEKDGSFFIRGVDSFSI